MKTYQTIHLSNQQLYCNEVLTVRDKHDLRQWEKMSTDCTIINNSKINRSFKMVRMVL